MNYKIPTLIFILFVVIFVTSEKAEAATITVLEPAAGCTLIDALTSAHTDTATGLCVAGSGNDTISLTADILITADPGTEMIVWDTFGTLFGALTIEGNNFTIARDTGSGNFRFLDIEFGNVTLQNISIKDFQETTPGGAIQLTDGFLTLNSVRMEGNRGAIGGAIYTTTSSGGGFGPAHTGNVALTITDSLFTENRGFGNHGAIGMTGTGTTLNITNTTFYDNNGGTFNGALYADPTVSGTIAYSTFVNNQAVNNVGAADAAGVNFVGNIFEGNTAAAQANCFLGINSGYNYLITGDATAAGCTAPIATDVVGATSGVATTLTYPNGFMGVLELDTGDAAIDMAGSGSCPSNDAVGNSRPLDGDGDNNAVCDAGAFEAVSSMRVIGTPGKSPKRPRFTCRDSEAVNYDNLGRHMQKLCQYEFSVTLITAQGGMQESPVEIFSYLDGWLERRGECPYFGRYLKPGENHTGEDIMEIKKWQEFLGKIGGSIPITGVYDTVTIERVRGFQLRFRSQILDPWARGNSTLSSNSTGWIYKTTRSFANALLGCDDGGKLYLEDTGLYYDEHRVIADAVRGVRGW